MLRGKQSHSEPDMPKRRAPEAQLPTPASEQTTIDNERKNVKEKIEPDERFDVFDNLPLTTNVEDNKWVKYLPTTRTDNEVHFSIPVSRVFACVNNIKLQWKCRVRADANSDAGPAFDADWGIIDDPATTMWKQAKVSVSGQTLTATNQNLAYGKIMKTYAMDNLENLGSRNQGGLTLDSAFYKQLRNNANSDMQRRKRLFQHPGDPWPRTGTPPAADKRPFNGTPTFFTDLEKAVDFFNNPKLVIPGVEIEMVLYKQDDAFVLMGPDGAEYTTEVLEPTLWIQYIKAIPSKSVQLQTTLFENNDAAKYAIQSTMIRTFTLPGGVNFWRRGQIFENNTPNVVLLAMVDSTARSGAYKENPFDFKTYGLTDILVTKGVEEAAPRLYCDPEGDYAEAVEQLYRATGHDRMLHGTRIINRDNFRGGYAIFGYCLTPDGEYKPWSVKEGINTGGQGVGVEIRFSQNLPHNVDLIAVGLVDNNVFIDGGRNVVLETQI